HITLFTSGAFRSLELDICYPAAWGAAGMEAALASLCAHAEDAIHLGYNILIISDRKISAELMPIPVLLATAAVHQHLVRKGLRTSTGLVVETGSAREVHHFALLAGYGAEAIHPYLALESLGQLHEYIPEISAEGAYRLHELAFGDSPVLRDALDAGGEYQYRIRGEEHMWTPESIAKLQHATRANSATTYRDYARLVNEQGKRLMTLRGLFEFKFAPEPV